jgi:hypothetical protein
VYNLRAVVGVPAIVGLSKNVCGRVCACGSKNVCGRVCAFCGGTEGSTFTDVGRPGVPAGDVIAVVGSCGTTRVVMYRGGS